jgi:predicted oxidoreductase
VQAAVEADDAAGALVAVRRLVVAYDNLGQRVDDAAARALHALVEPVLGLVRRGV